MGSMIDNFNRTWYQDVLGYAGAISKILHWSKDILFRTCEIIGVGGGGYA